VNDIVLLRLRIQTRLSFNVQFESNGPPLHQFIALIDNELAGNSTGTVGQNGSCFYGGAAKYFMSGNRCGRANSWQMRVIHSDRSAFSNNIISENAGAFEALKMHCVGGTSSLCRFNVISDNLLAKQRLRVTEGADFEGAVFKDSVIERNFVNGEIGTEHPSNLYRYNVADIFHVRIRVFNAQLTRGNMVINNTFFNRGQLSYAVVADSGSDVAGDRRELVRGGGADQSSRLRAGRGIESDRCRQGRTRPVAGHPLQPSAARRS
jgi:hypothetical protein